MPKLTQCVACHVHVCSLGVLTRNMIRGMNTKALMRIQVREIRDVHVHTHAHTLHTDTSNLQFPIDLSIAVQYIEKDPFIEGNWENRLLAQTNLYASRTGHFAQSNGIGILWLLFARQISLQWTWWQWLQSPNTNPGNRKMQSAVPGFVLTCPHSVFPFVAMMIWMKWIPASSVPCVTNFLSATCTGIHLPDISAQISIIWAWCPPATTCICTLTFTLIQVWPRHTCFISLSSITCNFPGAT